MRRRDFITLIGGVAVAWPLGARASERRIGVLMSPAADELEGRVRFAAFRDVLQQLGWTGRPSYNTGVGFYTLTGSGTVNASSNPKIYDANGKTFRPRGVNRLHWGDNCDAGIAASGANCERYVFGWVAALFSTYLPLIISDGIVPIAVDFVSSTGTVTSGDTNPATITQVVSDWINGVGGVGGAAAWKPFEKYLILNIANEWGPQTSTWQSTYITAVQSLRAAGFNNLILIDAPGSGQDGGTNPFTTTVIPYGPGIIEADPQHNVAFGCHVYGNIRAGQALSKLTPLAQSGLPAIISEFGPGRNIGPSPTDLTPGELISACEQLGLGWIGWAFDDNDQANASSDDNWFAMSWADFPGTATQPWWPAGATGGAYAHAVATDLTTFGSNIILGTSPWGASPAGNVPGMCLSALAKKCSIFAGGSPS